jgi:hypothetical protein
MMTHAQKTIFFQWVELTSPYSLTKCMRSRQFNSLLAAGFCVGLARNGLTQSAVLFSIIFLPRAGLCHHIVIELGSSSSHIPPFGIRQHTSILTHMICSFNSSDGVMNSCHRMYFFVDSYSFENCSTPHENMHYSRFAQWTRSGDRVHQSVNLVKN